MANNANDYRCVRLKHGAPIQAYMNVFPGLLARNREVNKYQVLQGEGCFAIAHLREPLQLYQTDGQSIQK